MDSELQLKMKKFSENHPTRMLIFHVQKKGPWHSRQENQVFGGLGPGLRTGASLISSVSRAESLRLSRSLPPPP